MRSLIEWGLLVIGALAAFSLTDFGGVWMPPMAVMIVATVLAISCVIVGALFFFDHARDEREEYIRNAAARIAYGTGLAVLVTGIAYRALTHAPPDPWLLGAVIAMTATIVLVRKAAS